MGQWQGIEQVAVQAVTASAGLPLSEAAGLAHTELAQLYTAQGNYQRASQVTAQHNQLLAAKATLTEQLQQKAQQLELAQPARQRQARQATAATVAAAVVLLLLVAAGLWVYNRRIKNAALYALQNVTTTADWQLTAFRSHLKSQMALPWRKIEFDKPVTDDDLAEEAVQELLKDANRANKNDDDNDNEDDEDYNQYLK